MIYYDPVELPDPPPPLWQYTPTTRDPADHTFRLFDGHNVIDLTGAPVECNVLLFGHGGARSPLLDLMAKALERVPPSARYRAFWWAKPEPIERVREIRRRLRRRKRRARYRRGRTGVRPRHRGTR